MTMQRPEEYAERVETVPPFRVHLVSYRLGSVFHAVADNVDPGAVLARTSGATRGAAEEEALSRVRARYLRHGLKQAGQE